jgi:thiamine biosynthesis lipoprotein
MGTIIGIDVRDAAVPESAIDDAVDWLTDVDARFSPYRAASEISRLARGEVAAEDCAADVRFVLTRCEALRRESDGFFDIRGPGLLGGLDPSGYVKGWAVEEAAHILEAAGARNYAINAGGDVILRGEPEPESGRPWVVGIRHPLEIDVVVARLSFGAGTDRRAVATSGLYERGEHILDPHTGRAPGELLSATVVGPSLALADAYATTVFAMGAAGLPWLALRPGYGGYVIDAGKRPSWTADVDELLAAGREAVGAGRLSSAMALVVPPPGPDLDARAVDRNDAQRAVLLQDGQLHLLDRGQPVLAQGRLEIVLVEALLVERLGQPGAIAADHGWLELEQAPDIGTRRRSSATIRFRLKIVTMMMIAPGID